MDARHFPEGIVVQVQPAAVQARPRDLMLDKPSFESIRLEGPPFKGAIVMVYLENQLVLNCGPALPEAFE